MLQEIMGAGKPSESRDMKAPGVGDGAAHRTSELLPLVYTELRRLAADRLAREPAGHSLDATALVHEVYLRLTSGGGAARWHNRAHFFGAAAEAMRRVLVDHARASKRLKRGGGSRGVSFEEADIAGARHPSDVIDLDAVLTKLDELDPELAETVKLRCFIGLSIAETAEALGVSTRTIDRRWTVAKAWLKAALAEHTAGADVAKDGRMPH
jgi:RNA polymerase sigma factor (TIGR02999 family)